MRPKQFQPKNLTNIYFWKKKNYKKKVGKQKMLDTTFFGWAFFPIFFVAKNNFWTKIFFDKKVWPTKNTGKKKFMKKKNLAKKTFVKINYFIGQYKFFQQNKKLYHWYYLHMSRDSVSPVCEIFAKLRYGGKVFDLGTDSICDHF